jgi:hypothetical protein
MSTKKIIPLTLLAIGAGLCANAAVLTHRYDFNGDASDFDDATIKLDGMLSSAGTNLEKPLFTTDIPGGADTSFASQSIEFGMNVGSTASWIFFGNGSQTKIFDNKAGSFSYWFKADQVSGNQELVSNIGGMRTRISGGELQVLSAASGAPPASVTAGAWHHLVIGWDDVNSQWTSALDGNIQKQAFGTPGGLTDPARLIVGNFEESANKLATQFNGHIYDFQIYEGVLSDMDIAFLYKRPGKAIQVPESGSFALIAGCLVLVSVMLPRRRLTLRIL